MSEMFYDYSKRDYLLPNGCKDLIDVLKLKQLQAKQETPATLEGFMTFVKPDHYLWHKPKSAPPPTEIVVREQTSVRELANLLNQRPFQIIADLMALKIMATANQPLNFETVAKIAANYGCTAKQAI